jgi:type I restriction enzyme S subunit
MQKRIGDLFDVKAGGDLQEANYSPYPTAEAQWPIYANSLEKKGLYGYTSRPRFSGNAVTITGRGDIGHAEFRPDDFDAIVRLLVLLPKAEVDCRYITYYINSHVHFPKESTGVPQLTAPKVKRIKIDLPQSKEEQTAIANILFKVDEAIASAQDSITAAERLKKSLMQNLLTGKMKPDGTFRTPDEFYIDEKFGKVPVGWHWGRLSEIADIIAGQSPQGEYYNVNEMGKPMLNGPTEFTDKYPVPVQWTTKITKLCKKGDILFTVRGSSTGRMNLADQEYCIGRGLAAIRPKSNNNISFIYYTLLKISEMILTEAKGAGTTFPNVSRGELMKKVILIPDTHQNEIIAPIEQLARFSDSKQRSIDKLEILKKSLMQNLLTGKVYINSKILNI